MRPIKCPYCSMEKLWPKDHELITPLYCSCSFCHGLFKYLKTKTIKIIDQSKVQYIYYGKHNS
jgi:hypothetical protein